MTFAVSQPAMKCHNMVGVTRVRVGTFPVPFMSRKEARENAMTEIAPDFDRLLLTVARQRDAASFEILFRHFGPRVKSWLLRRVKDRQASEELMQETMMTVWNKASLFDPSRGNASGWIFTIARNTFISAYRKQNRPEFDPEDPAFAPEAPESADTMMSNRQEAGRLVSAVNALPEEQKELVRLAFFSDIPHTRLAEQFNLPLGTVKSRIRIAMAKLRKNLGERA